MAPGEDDLTAAMTTYTIWLEDQPREGEATGSTKGRVAKAQGRTL
jgi:hypothetical protein